MMVRDKGPPTQMSPVERTFQVEPEIHCIYETTAFVSTVVVVLLDLQYIKSESPGPVQCSSPQFVCGCV